MIQDPTDEELNALKEEVARPFKDASPEAALAVLLMLAADVSACLTADLPPTNVSKVQGYYCELFAQLLTDAHEMEQIRQPPTGEARNDH